MLSSPDGPSARQVGEGPSAGQFRAITATYILEMPHRKSAPTKRKVKPKSKPRQTFTKALAQSRIPAPKKLPKTLKQILLQTQKNNRLRKKLTAALTPS